MFECDIAHRRSVAVLCMLYKVRLTRRTHLMMLYLDRMCQCRLHEVPWSHISILMCRLAAEPRSTAGLLFPSQCPSETILLTPFSMVWTGRFQEQGKYFFIGLSCSISTIVYSYFSFSIPSVYRLVLRGWDLRTDRVYITLSLRLALPTSFNNNMIEKLR